MSAVVDSIFGEIEIFAVTDLARADFERFLGELGALRYVARIQAEAGGYRLIMEPSVSERMARELAVRLVA